MKFLNAIFLFIFACLSLLVILLITLPVMIIKGILVFFIAVLDYFEKE